MAKTKASAAVSFNPSDMIGGGLKDDFRGVIREAVYAPWDYNGNIEEPVLGVRLTIEELDVPSGEPLGADTEPIVQYWPAGSLTDFMPSSDGESPNDGEGMEIEPGPYAVKVGKKAALNNNTNFAHLMQTIMDVGKAKEMFGSDQLTPSLDCLEGLDAHWNRVPQKKRSGLTEDSEKKTRDVLVVTDMYGYREEAAKTAKGSTKAPAKGGKPAPKVEEEEAEEAGRSAIDTKLDEIVKAALGDAKDNVLKKGKLASIVLKEAAKDKDKAKMVKRVGEDDYLNSIEDVVYDDDEGTVTLIEA